MLLKLFVWGAHRDASGVDIQLTSEFLGRGRVLEVLMTDV